MISINVAATLMLAVLGITNTSFNESHSAFASTNSANSTVSLGNPFFVEKGKIIGQRVLSVSPQPQLEFTIRANRTINNTINFTNIGTTVSNLRLMEYSIVKGKDS